MAVFDRSFKNRLLTAAFVRFRAGGAACTGDVSDDEEEEEEEEDNGDKEEIVDKATFALAFVGACSAILVRLRGLGGSGTMATLVFFRAGGAARPGAGGDDEEVDEEVEPEDKEDKGDDACKATFVLPFTFWFDCSAILVRVKHEDFWETSFCKGDNC